MASLNVQPINCTRKTGGESSAEAMIAVIAVEFEAKGATVAETVRAAAFDIKSGVCSDEGDGDDWPHVREKILAADILILGTPIWMDRRTASPSASWSGWTRSSRKPTTEFKDLDATPEMVAKMAKMVATNATHLAMLLKADAYPG